MKKKVCSITITILLMFFLCSCGSEEPKEVPKEYSVTVNLEYQKVPLTTNSEVNVYVDDIKLGRQEAGTSSSYSVSLTEGDHKFYLKNDGLWKSEEVTFSVSDSKKSFSFGTKTRLTFGMEIWMNNSN